MVAITASMVAELRAKTDAPMMECKKALAEAGGDMARAEEILRVKLGNKAGKAAARITAEGVVAVAVDGDVGALVEINCETDFVANTDDFRQLARNIAMQVAAMNPQVVAADDPERAGIEGTDEEVCLMSQPFIRDSGRTIGSLVQDTIAKTGENVRVRRFVRFELGR